MALFYDTIHHEIEAYVEEMIAKLKKGDDRLVKICRKYSIDWKSTS